MLVCCSGIIFGCPSVAGKLLALAPAAGFTGIIIMLRSGNGSYATECFYDPGAAVYMILAAGGYDKPQLLFFHAGADGPCSADGRLAVFPDCKIVVRDTLALQLVWPVFTGLLFFTGIPGWLSSSRKELLSF